MDTMSFVRVFVVVVSVVVAAPQFARAGSWGPPVMPAASEPVPSADAFYFRADPKPAASAWLDNRLAFDPLRFGTPIDSSVHRSGSFDGLGVEFEVIEDDKRVIVHGVFTAG